MKTIRAKHAIITDECRENKGDLTALGEATQRIHEAVFDLLRSWPRGKGTKFHLIAEVEYPTPEQGGDSDA